MALKKKMAGFFSSDWVALGAIALVLTQLSQPSTLRSTELGYVRLAAVALQTASIFSYLFGLDRAEGGPLVVSVYVGVLAAASSVVGFLALRAWMTKGISQRAATISEITAFVALALQFAYLVALLVAAQSENDRVDTISIAISVVAGMPIFFILLIAALNSQRVSRRMEIPQSPVIQLLSDSDSSSE